MLRVPSGSWPGQEGGALTVLSLGWRPCPSPTRCPWLAHPRASASSAEQGEQPRGSPARLEGGSSALAPPLLFGLGLLEIAKTNCKNVLYFLVKRNK